MYSCVLLLLFFLLQPLNTPEKSVHGMEALSTHVHQHIFFPFLCTLTPSQLIIEFPHECLLLPVVPNYNALVRYHAPIVTVSSIG
jgi:hypothetical protein